MMAKRKLTYAGKQIPLGTEFEALSRSDAAVLSTLHYAVPVKDPETKLENPETVPGMDDPGPEAAEMKPKQKRRYKRRDMRAE